MNGVQDLLISEAAWPYLVAQNGAIDDMKADFGTWCNAYADLLASKMASIDPHLPRECTSILDVGSGLGGIDILLNRHYGGGCRVSLLDGMADPPTAGRHDATFSNMGIAAEFLRMNGVKAFDFIDANNAHRSAPRFYDLIVSFKSWCFHYPPEVHLDLVLSACIPGQTHIIVDMRGGAAAYKLSDAQTNRAAEWLRTMSANFEHKRRIYCGFKFETHLFIAK